MQPSTSDAALLRLAATLRDGGYRFITPTPATHERVNRRAGNAWARGVEDVFGWSRPFRDGVLAPEIVTLVREAGVLARAGEGWRSLVRLSSLGDALFLHSAYPTDAADAVFFGPDTYRFASALDAYLAARTVPVCRAVDIGCGAGPGAVLIALARPEAEVLAVDINEAALRLTRVNAALAGAGNVVACQSDLLSGVPGQFDLIVSNPPYLVDPAARAYRHGGGPLGAGPADARRHAAALHGCRGRERDGPLPRGTGGATCWARRCLDVSRGRPGRVRRGTRGRRLR